MSDIENLRAAIAKTETKIKAHKKSIARLERHEGALRQRLYTAYASELGVAIGERRRMSTQLRAELVKRWGNDSHWIDEYATFTVETPFIDGEDRGAFVKGRHAGQTFVDIQHIKSCEVF